MAKPRSMARLLAGLLLVGGAGPAAAAAPTVAQMLSFRPKQENVAYATPDESALAGCKVELVKGGGRASGWLLRDPRGQPLRRFFDSNGDNAIDVYSYFQDGQEVYREVDSNFNGKVDQYRWLGANGSRWGVDLNEDGKIDGWKVISPEEVSQEVLQAVARRDSARLQALVISDAELQSLDLPEAEAARVRESVAKVPAKFQQTVAGLIGLSDKTTWVHLETPAPQCTPADALGSKADLLRYKHGTVLYENAGKADWLQTGEMVLVGRAWRLTDAPAAGSRQDAGPQTGGIAIDADIKPLVEQLQAVDKNAPKTGDPAEVSKYNLARATVLEQIVAKAKPDQREQWLRQVADCLSAAAQSSAAGDTAAYQRLVALRDGVARDPGLAKLAGYVTYREMTAEYALKMGDPAKSAKLVEVQEAWLERLRKFASDYPAAEDAPDALLQLGMVSEFLSKETDAKNWYALLVKNYADHPLAAKARGAARRLDLEGKSLELAGPVLGSEAPFDVARLRGKVVAVYYWASWNGQCVGDFAKMKSLLNAYAPKGLELVTVNLDNSSGEAVKYLQANPTPGTHLFQQPGGLDSPRARRACRPAASSPGPTTLPRPRPPTDRRSARRP